MVGLPELQFECLFELAFCRLTFVTHKEAMRACKNLDGKYLGCRYLELKMC
jgi:hypothetical protein